MCRSKPTTPVSRAVVLSVVPASVRSPDCAYLRVGTPGVDLRRSRVPGEGHSIYFYDHDNHMFELHSGTLPERLERYSKPR